MMKILCKAKTKKGTPCQNKPNLNSKFCRIHVSTKSPEPLPSESDDPIFIEQSELDIGDLTNYFPNEIIHEMLKYLNIFDLINFSIVNRSCGRFVKKYKMIPNSMKIRFKNFVEYFKEKQSIMNSEKAIEYGIPVCQGQQLIVYPSRFIGMKKVELLVRKGVCVKFKQSDENCSWVYNKNEFPSFDYNFVPMNKTTKHILESSSVKWNMREMYLHVESMNRYLQEYRMKHPERIVK